MGIYSYLPPLILKDPGSSIVVRRTFRIVMWRFLLDETQNCYGAVSSEGSSIIGGSSSMRHLHLWEGIYRDRQRIVILNIQPTAKTHQASSHSMSYLNIPLQLHQDSVKESSILRN